MNYHRNAIKIPQKLQEQVIEGALESHRKSIEIQEKYNGIPTGKPKEISQEYQRNAIEIPQKPISFNAVAAGSSAAVAAVSAAEQYL